MHVSDRAAPTAPSTTRRRGNMRKKLGATETVLVSAMALAACGSGDSGSSSGGGDDDQITLRVMYATVVENPEGDAERAQAEAFMDENPHINIEFIGTPMNELYTQLTTMATGGNVPDVFTHSPELYAMALALSNATPLDATMGAA